VLLLHSNLSRNIALLTGFAMVYWHYAARAYSFGPPISCRDNTRNWAHKITGVPRIYKYTYGGSAEQSWIWRRMVCSTAMTRLKSSKSGDVHAPHPI